MKLSSIIKATVIGAGAVVGAIIGPPLYAIGASAADAYKRTATFMVKKPHAATLAMLAAGIITYGACNHHDYLKRQAVHMTTHVIERYRTSHEHQSNTIPAEEVQTGLEKAIQTPVPEKEEIAFIESPGTNYYFVKPGDTLTKIAEHVNGNPKTYPRIMLHNNIRDTRQIPVGMLLRIPEELCTLKVNDVYKRVPRLEQRLLSNRDISDEFPNRWREVLALNHDLGLNYNDEYRGKRIVYSHRQPVPLRH